jgi:hypothetical protein
MVSEHEQKTECGQHHRHAPQARPPCSHPIIAAGSHPMNASRRAFPTRVLVALHIAAAIFTSLARADSLPNPAEWRAGGR